MIGFYDSGIGGLTILNQVLELTPRLDTYYYADNKNCPLGEKSLEEIQAIVVNSVEYLFDQGCDLVVLACNTATAASIKYIQQQWLPKHYPNKNVLGVIRPVILGLIEEGIDPTAKVVIMATPATVATSFYTLDLKDYNYNNVYEISMSGLAIAIETKDNQKAQRLIDQAFEANKEHLAKASALVLACTHYPYQLEYFKSKLNSISNPDCIVNVQNSIVAEQLIKYLDKHKQYGKYNDQHQYYNSR